MKTSSKLQSCIYKRNNIQNFLNKFHFITTLEGQIETSELVTFYLKTLEEGKTLNVETETVIQELNSYLEKNPEQYEAYVLRGMLYKSKKFLEHAMNDFTKAIEINPDQIKGYLERGNKMAFMNSRFIKI